MALEYPTAVCVRIYKPFLDQTPHRNGLVLSIHKFAVRVFSDRLKCGVPRESCTIGVFVLASSAGSDSMDSMIR